MFQDIMSLEIHASCQDVERYIEGQLDRLLSFVQENRSLQAEIKEGIAHAADGMYVST